MTQLTPKQITISPHLITFVCIKGIPINGWCQNWMFSPFQGCLLGNYKPFSKKISFLPCKKKPILSVFTNTFKKKYIYIYIYASYHKSDLISWLRYGVRIPKQFSKLKSDTRFMFYGIHVFTHIRESHKSWTVSRISIFKTVLKSLHHI